MPKRSEVKNSPAKYFDPEQWNRIYNQIDGEVFKFKHGADLVEQICLQISSPGQLWIDVGCGTGNLAYRLSKMQLSVIGIDHDQRMINFARRIFLKDQSESGLNLKFLKSFAERLPFGDDSVDGVIATSMAGCLPDVRLFLKEAFRILQKNGIAIITFTNKDSLLLKINYYLNTLKNFVKNVPTKCENYRVYSLPSISNEFKEIGFKIVIVRHYNFFLNIGRFLFPPKKLALFCEKITEFKIGRIIGRNFIIVAQK